jgi:hypothetical protein
LVRYLLVPLLLWHHLPAFPHLLCDLMEYAQYCLECQSKHSRQALNHARTIKAMPGTLAGWHGVYALQSVLRSTMWHHVVLRTTAPTDLNVEKCFAASNLSRQADSHCKMLSPNCQ